MAHTEPEPQPSPCVPGGYYLTSLSASLALLSGLTEAHTLPLSPSQELQRSLSLWEQRRLPATHCFQVTPAPGGTRCHLARPLLHPVRLRRGRERGRAGLHHWATASHMEHPSEPVLLDGASHQLTRLSALAAQSLHRN